MLSQKLKRLRENCGYTQKQVADALSIERSTYTYYEIGKTTPDINTIIKLAKIFNVSYNDMLENEEQKNSVSLFDSFDDFYGVYTPETTRHIYELSKKEKALISLFRSAPSEVQKDIVKILKEKIDVASGKRKFL